MTKGNLFKLAIMVTPAPAHPMYYDWQWGWLLFWIHAESYDRAAALATAIVTVLPYEIMHPEPGGIRVVPFPDLKQYPPEHKNSAAVRRAEYDAGRLGLGMLLDAAATGVDEPQPLFLSPQQ